MLTKCKSRFPPLLKDKLLAIFSRSGTKLAATKLGSAEVGSTEYYIKPAVEQGKYASEQIVYT
eukprot:2465528-Amphidinium_carterae.1